MTTFDVAVIGGGIHGVSAAFHLSRRGVRTVLFERRGPAGGPTGRSSAICRAYYTNEFLARCARDSIRMFENFEEITAGGDAGFRRTGALFLHSEEDRAQVVATAERLNRLGIPTEVIGPQDVAARFPEFELTDIGLAAWEDDAGYADPAGATQGLLRRAVEMGLEPRLWTWVAGIELHTDTVSLLATDRSRTEAERLLIAAGPWTRALTLQLGVDLPLTVERHVVGTFRWAGAAPMPLHADLPGGYYFRPEGKELYLVGPLHPAPAVDPDHFEERIREAETHELARRVTRRIPQLERSESAGGWASLYDVSPDWQPVIGEIAPRVFVDAGTSGHGFKLAPALGEHVAGVVLGERVDPGLEQFHPRRFEQGAGLAAGYGDARILG